MFTCKHRQMKTISKSAGRVNSFVSLFTYRHFFFSLTFHTHKKITSKEEREDGTGEEDSRVIGDGGRRQL